MVPSRFRSQLVAPPPPPLPLPPYAFTLKFAAFRLLMPVLIVRLCVDPDAVGGGKVGTFVAANQFMVFTGSPIKEFSSDRNRSSRRSVSAPT